MRQRGPRPPLILVSPKQPPRQPRLAPLLDRDGTILVLLSDWRAISDRQLRDARSRLGQELERYQQLRTDHARGQLLSSRWLVHWTLAAALGPSVQPELTAGPLGRPALVAHPELDVSLSHSARAVLVGLSGDRRIGVDIEPVDRDLRRLRIAGALCTPAESARLAKLAHGDDNDFLLRTWTLKEAHGKLLGTGIGCGFKSFGFSFSAWTASCVDPTGQRASPDVWDYHSWRAHGLWLAVAASHDRTPAGDPRSQALTLPPSGRLSNQRRFSDVCEH